LIEEKTMKTAFLVSILLACLLVSGFARPTAALSPATQQCSAPVLVAVTPSDGSADTPQDLLLSGSNFLQPGGASAVTSVFAAEVGNPANVIQAVRFTVLSSNLIDAFINFGSANACKSFRIGLNGPCGASTQDVVFITSCPTPVQQTSMLKDNVVALVDAGVLTRRQGRSLTRHLDRALNSLEQDRINAAIRQLQRFINEVNELIAEGSLPSASGQPLIDKATAVIGQLT
jgi:hypothetical protein